MSDFEKSSAVTYPFYFINRQSMHKTNCMQRIKKILMREVFPAIVLKDKFVLIPIFYILNIYKNVNISNVYVFNFGEVHGIMKTSGLLQS